MQFGYWLLIGYMKTLAVLKRQQFKNSESDKAKPRDSKYQWFYIYDNKMKKGLDEFQSKDKGKNIQYILFPFIAFLQKESNRLTDIDKRIKSLNPLICIPKIGLSYNCLFYVRIFR